MVHPGEILSSFGWPADVECKLMHWKDIQDLAGESQALQAIGVVTTALIKRLAVGRRARPRFRAVLPRRAFSALRMTGEFTGQCFF